jgi:hypothetical protein
LPIEEEDRVSMTSWSEILEPSELSEIVAMNRELGALIPMFYFCHSDENPQQLRSGGRRQRKNDR